MARGITFSIFLANLFSFLARGMPFQICIVPVFYQEWYYILIFISFTIHYWIIHFMTTPMSIHFNNIFLYASLSFSV